MSPTPARLAKWCSHSRQPRRQIAALRAARRFVSAFAVVGVIALAPAAHAQSSGMLFGLRHVDAPKTITLDQAFALALDHNVDLRLAGSRVAEADARVQQAWASLLPQVSAGAEYDYNYPEIKIAFTNEEQLSQQALLYNSIADITAGSAQQIQDPVQRRAALERADALRAAARDIQNTEAQQIVVSPAHVVNGQVQVALALFNARALPMLQAAYNGADISRAGVRQARAQVLFAVARTYYQAVAAERIVDIANKQVTSATSRRELSASRHQLGYVTQLQLDRAELEVVRAEGQLRQARAGAATAKGVLGSLLGLGEEFLLETPPALLAIEKQKPADELINTALRSRDDIRMQRQALELADRSVSEAWMRYLPVVRLVASGRYTSNTSGFNNQPITGTVAVQANMPIFDGGQTWGAINESRARMQQELLRVRQLEVAVEQDVRGAVDDIGVKQSGLETATRVATLARGQAEQALALFENGNVTGLELADANMAAFAAEVDATRAAFDLELSRLQLAKTLGDFLPAQPMDPRELSGEEEDAARDFLKKVDE